MSMAKEQIEHLRRGILAYSYPKVTYDFSTNQFCSHTTMGEVEQVIRRQLLSGDPTQTRDGLSNVIFWGYCRDNRRRTRFKDFRREVSPRNRQLAEAARIFQDPSTVDLLGIKRLSLPEFSGLSFLTKVRMFLDPTRYATLDRKLLKNLRSLQRHFAFRSNERSIRATRRNVRAYEGWAQLCRNLAEAYFERDGFHAADVERGFYALIDLGDSRAALEAYREAERWHST